MRDLEETDFDVARLAGRAGTRLPEEDSRSFAVIEILEGGERLLAVDTCPAPLELGAIAEDTTGALHALCRAQLALSTPRVVLGTFDPTKERFQWLAPSRLGPDFDASADRWLLAIVGQRPVIGAGLGGVWRVAIPSLTESAQDVPLVFGLFTVGQALVAVHTVDGLDVPTYFTTTLTAGRRAQRAPLKLPVAARRPAHWDLTEPWILDEPPVLATLEGGSRVSLRLPELRLADDAPAEPNRALVYAAERALPVGGPRVIGHSRAGFAGQREELRFECSPEKDVVLTRGKTRYARASCSQHRCLLVYSRPWQAGEVGGPWWKASFHVRRLDMNSCVDITP